MIVEQLSKVGIKANLKTPEWSIFNTEYKNGKYRGKPDTRPWDNAPAAHGSPDWKKGDQVGWENRVRDRAATQNEYGRIGH